MDGNPTLVRPARPKRGARSCHVDSFIERTFRALEIFACTCLRLIDSGSGGMGFYAAQSVGVGAVTLRDSDETPFHISYRDCRISYTSCRGSRAQLVRDRLRMALFYPSVACGFLPAAPRVQWMGTGMRMASGTA